MDVSLVIRRRIEDLGVEQRDLTTAAQVTESYISQLLTRKKAPSAPHQTDIYDKIEQFLRLPSGELSKLAGLQRKEVLQRRWEDPLAPLFKEVRALIFRKCNPDNGKHICTIFEKQPFGELECFVTQKLKEMRHATVPKDADGQHPAFSGDSGRNSRRTGRCRGR